MAAHRAVFVCAFGRSAAGRVFPLPQKPHREIKSLFNPSLQPRVYYRSRETDEEEECRVLVPVERLSVSYSRSSGAGGQHVNKVNTKAEVRFHVLTADWLPGDVRRKVFDQNQNRINKAGELLVTSERSRSQHRNLSDCIQKISDMVAEASRRQKEPTEEDVALREARLQKSNRERLRQKKIHSTTKQSRRPDFD